MKKISARWRNLYTKAGFSSFMASLLAILCGLVVGFVVLLVADPANAFWGLLAILTGGLSDMKNLGQVLYAATPIILTGLSVGFANKTGLFNIGASGQFIVGAYVAVLMGVKCTFIPGPLLWLACLLGAMLAGAGKGIEVLDTLAAEGFNGIPVALLGLNNPIGIIFSGLFVAYLNQGGFNMQVYGFAPQVIDIIISVVIYFAAFSLLLRGFVERRVKRREEKRAADGRPAVSGRGPQEGGGAE